MGSWCGITEISLSNKKISSAFSSLICFFRPESKFWPSTMSSSWCLDDPYGIIRQFCVKNASVDVNAANMAMNSISADAVSAAVACVSEFWQLHQQFLWSGTCASVVTIFVMYWCWLWTRSSPSHLWDGRQICLTVWYQWWSQQATIFPWRCFVTRRSAGATSAGCRAISWRSSGKSCRTRDG